MADFIAKICHNLERFSQETAFVINDQSYTYTELSSRICAIQNSLLSDDNQQKYALWCDNHINTYASILALWFSGKTFVPLNPAYPALRNKKIISLSGCQSIISTNELPEYKDHTVYLTSNSGSKGSPILMDHSDDAVLYVLFTSGSTGEPKGVPVSYRNFQSFIEASLSTGFEFTSDDRFLQMYDLTFDGAFQSYIVPLLFGASVYTLKDGLVKYMAIAKLLTSKNITVAKMTPSVLYYLRPWFDQIHLPHLRYSVFGGEALPVSLVRDWSKCIPNSEIVNVYGPSETTVNVLSYRFKSTNNPLEWNGYVSIGKGHQGVECELLNEGEGDANYGELSISGKQVFNGYLSEEAECPFTELNGVLFYKTGDRVYQDQDGFYYFKDRMDNQVQLNGYRVELSEIEAVVKAAFNSNSVACPVGEVPGVYFEIILYVETDESEQGKIENYLRTAFPEYMRPSRIECLKHFPLLSSGKVDRQKLMIKAGNTNPQQ